MHAAKTLLKRTLIAASACAALFFAAVPAAQADVAGVHAALLKKFPKLNPNAPIAATGIPGIYEVNLSGKAAYTDEKVSFFLLNGHLIDPVTLKDITDERQMQVIHSGFTMLPLDTALKSVYGNGKRILVAFEDPDCEFCRREHAEVWEPQAGQLNATVYTFLLPLTGLHPNAERDSLAILCSPNPDQAWRKWMSTPQPVAGNLPPPSTCDAGAKRLANMVAEGQNRGFNGTPTMMFESGQISSLGALTFDQLVKGFALSSQFMDAMNQQATQAKLDSAMPAPSAPAPGAAKK